MTVSRYNLVVVLTVALGSFTYGFDSAIIGSVFGLPSFFSYFGLTLNGSSSASIIGAANGLFAGGGMIGAAFNGWLADRLGRVKAIQIPCVLGVIAAAIMGASVHVAMFLVGRCLSGIACGMFSIATPLYQSEISPAHQRGKMVGSHGILVVTGYAFAAWTGYGCYFETHLEAQWRLCLSLQAVAPLLLVLTTPWIPESPRWLISQGQRDQAWSTLNRLQPVTTDHDGSTVEIYREICEQIAVESESSNNVLQSIKDPQTRKRLLCVFFVQCLAQSSGILVISNYQILLWNNLGLYGSLPLLLYSVYTSWAAILNWVASRMVDRLGRVRMMVVGICGCVVMMSCYTAMVARYSSTDNQAGNVMGIVFLFLHVTFYAIFVDTVSYVYCSEIFPMHERAKGMALSIFGLFMMTLTADDLPVYTEAASTAFAQVGWKYYLVFIIVPASGVPVLARLPETKGLTLEESATLFGIPTPPLGDMEKAQVEHIEGTTSGEDVPETMTIRH
ncbi:putative sugar transporter [Aspergillus aculeatinus CBS 121060]|uniref:Sugar transporter n=1 Tax=Aspergillus aculeatinus CBS 121060 TaxID=1448322 RepID=A0ACD1HA81_9EURO|nr:putative sugar transporter [Aspergillus aculeatinus CBS 121060]RAH70428.1 putative sugar transporter [Aspergillus aculeatinus CBS 121060]